MPLTDIQAKAAKAKEKTYRLSDEKGLYLEVTTTGRKYWRYKYRFAGKEKKLAIGVYPEISLKAARLEHEKARQLLREGIDPSANKQALKASTQVNKSNTFASVAREWITTRLHDKTEGHQRRVTRAVENDLIPKLGPLDINSINAPTLLQAIRTIEERGALETAHRTKQIAGQIFRYAIAIGKAERDPSADLKGALKNPIKKHFSAITDPKGVSKLLLAIDEYTGSIHVKSALKLSALWFCRPGELRHLEWANINNDGNRVELVSEKTKQHHIIPICSQAREILDQLEAIRGKSKYIFPSTRGASRCMSENTLRVALRSMGYSNEEMTAHGFRAMARTLLDEELDYRIEWIEQQLAHVVKDPNGRAYNRTMHLAQRTEMMQRWADYLDELRNDHTTS
jgi:integrase